MQAIKVNPETFSKIEVEVVPAIMEMIKKEYKALNSDIETEELFVTVNELSGNRNSGSKIYTGYAFFDTFVLMVRNGKDWRLFPDDWFEVELQRKKNNGRS